MKLVYFNGRGLAETSRLLLAINNQEYEDFRYPLNIIDIKSYKMEKPEFDKDKSNGLLTKSLNKLPYLEIDGEIISQSKSIERYLASRFKMLGDTALEAARIDSICEAVRDFKDTYKSVIKSDNVERGLNEWFNTTLVDKLNLLDSTLDGEQYSVGTKLSLADVVIYNFLTNFFDNIDESKKAYSQTRNIKKIVSNVSQLDSVNSWLMRRPDTVF